MKTLIILITILILELGISGQTPTPTPTAESKSKSATMYTVIESELLIRLCAIAPADQKCQTRNPVQEMTDGYLDIIRNDADQAKKLIARAAEKNTLQLVIVAQNQRIIELLEELVRKKP